VLDLQRSAGNSAVARLIGSRQHSAVAGSLGMSLQRSVEQEGAPGRRPNLDVGDSGPGVVLLQRMLGATETSVFDGQTRAAVDRFQRQQRWDPSGVGPMTWAALDGHAGEPGRRPNLVQGDRGPGVQMLQHLLGVSETRFFGAATRRAVDAFQKAQGWAPSGVGPMTWAALDGKGKAENGPAPSTIPVVSAVSRNPPVGRLGGPFSDAAVAAYLYGNPGGEVQHQPSDHSLVAVKVDKLVEARRAEYDDGSHRPGSVAKVVSIGAAELLSLGTQAELQRTLYQEGCVAIHKEAMVLNETEGLEAAARFAVAERNKLKAMIRGRGPALFKKLAEMRNEKKYGDPLGLGYEALRAAKSDTEIVDGVLRTSRGFNRAGPALQLTGAAGQVLVSGLFDSPESLPPLPLPSNQQVQAEQARLALHIPPTANIDQHGHLKPNFYLQLDIEDPHIDREFEAETDEILWALGVDITYHWANETWTVPGR
jgi:peptidoglycan hydrolase-like protein with peptidoglycan-binding domain